MGRTGSTMRNVYKFVFEKLKGMGQLGDLGVNRNMI
jgi:hypothetical protein